MIALDEEPAVAELARTATITDREGTVTVQAEDGALSGDAAAVVPPSLWTEESLFSGTGYAALGDGGSVTMTLPEHSRSLVIPVIDLRPGSEPSRRTARATGGWAPSTPATSARRATRPPPARCSR